MSFIDTSKKNVKKYNSSFKEKKKSTLSLKEVTGGEGVSGFVGRAGMGIDKLFTGGFHPDSGHGSKNLELLKKQIKDRIQKIKDTYSIEANPIGGWYNLNTKETAKAFEELHNINIMVKQYNDEMTPPPDVEWKSTGVNIDFDDIYIHIENEEDFINQSETNMKKVGVEIKYDDIPKYAGEDFINRSKTNWKLVGSK